MAAFSMQKVLFTQLNLCLTVFLKINFKHL